MDEQNDPEQRPLRPWPSLTFPDHETPVIAALRRQDVPGHIGDIALGDVVRYTAPRRRSANDARVQNAWLGGRDNYREDRDTARIVQALSPEAHLAAVASRAVLERLVEHFAACEHAQYLDLGAGLPVTPTVHEVAQRGVQDPRVVYVERDPVAAAHYRALLWRHPTCRALRADLLDVDQVMASDEVTDVLDLSQPVVVLFSSVLQSVTDDAEAARVVAEYASRLCSGSVVVITHLATPALLNVMLGGQDPRLRDTSLTAQHAEEKFAEAMATYADLVEPVQPRGRIGVLDLLGALDVEGDVTPAEMWGTDWPPDVAPTAPVLVAVGRVG